MNLINDVFVVTSPRLKHQTSKNTFLRSVDSYIELALPSTLKDFVRPTDIIKNCLIRILHRPRSSQDQGGYQGNGI